MQLAQHGTGNGLLPRSGGEYTKGSESQMERPLKKFAVVGMGILGKRHSNAQIQNPKAELVAVCDLYEAQMQEFVAAHPSVKMYTDARKMFQECDVDVAIIATQDPYHKDPLLAAIDAGIRYIICEKPLCTTLEDAREVKAAADAAGSKIIVAFSLRMQRCDRALRQLIKAGMLGRPLHGDVECDDCIYVPKKLWGKKSADWAKTSSPVYFLFSHAIDYLTFYLAPAKIQKVYAVGKQEGIGSYCDYCEAICTFTDGTVVRIKGDWTRKIPTLTENVITLTFEDAGVIYTRQPALGRPLMRLDFEDGEKMERAFAFLEQEGYFVRKIVDLKAYCKFAIEMYPDENLESYAASSVYMLDYLNDDGFLGLPECICDLDGGLYQVEVVDAINRSMETDAPVYL